MNGTGGYFCPVIKRPFVKYFLGGVAVSALLFFLLRNTVLQAVFNRTSASYKEKYSLQISAASVKFTGFDEVTIKQLVMQPAGKDTLARVEEVSVNLSLLDLLTGNIDFDEVNVEKVNITMYREPQRNNISVLGSGKDTVVALVGKATTNYRKAAGRYKLRLLRLFNTAFYANDVQIHYQDSLNTESIFIPKAAYDLKEFSAQIINRSNNDVLQLRGKVLEKNKTYRFEVTHNIDTIPYLPFLHDEKGLRCKFKRVAGLLNFEEDGDMLHVSANVSADNFYLGHWRLATEDIVIRASVFKGKLKVGENSIELDSTSAAAINGVKVSLFAAYNLKPEPLFQLGVHMPETVSDTFFHSLPQGVFNTLKGISCTGSLTYDLNFKLPTQRPDSLQFSSSMKKKDFNIRRFGADNYARINGPFKYEAYDKDRFVRMIEVGPANPHFTPLASISPYLVKAVLQSEDPSFMNHRGFLEEAFRESIVKNYKEKRFARGGSTISMQLVKNVYLSRDKTISRKAEEALIVYLIESERLVSKERMLEVYLNVIEWGPNVYGIGEASRFYFNKRPAELTLQESIFLAGIIPMPKYFKYQFDKEGKMKDYLGGYFRILSTRMVVRGAINANDTIGLAPDVELTGPARRLVVPDEMHVMPNEGEWNEE